MKPLGILSLVILWGAALLLALSLASTATAQSLAYEVNKAIERGVAQLRTLQNEDGSFRSTYADGYPTGVTALALYTLVKSEVPASDPAVAKGLAYLRYKPFVKTYSTTVLILALDSLKDPTYDPWVQNAARWLEETMHAVNDLWAYPEGECDLSNTQYAVLGLWAAERHGYHASRETWGRLLQALLQRQNEDGGFGYRGGEVSTGRMTTSGITILTLARERIKGDGRFDKEWRESEGVLKRAWGYLERRFSVEGNPTGASALTSDWYFYYLYGLERVAAIAELRKIGEHDWYVEGAEQLVKRQAPGGEWGNMAETCFALLFLRRATFSGMHPDKVAELDSTISRSRREAEAAKPLPTVPFIRRWLVLGPFDDPGDSLLEQPFLPEEKLAPKAGQRIKKLAWTPYASRSAFVNPELAVESKDHCLYYLFTYLHVAQECEAVLWFGTDDGCRVFLDGKLVFERHFHEGASVDANNATVTLSAGVHSLLVKIAEWVGQSGLYKRIAKPGGEPLEGVRPSLAAGDPELEQTALVQPELFSYEELLQYLPADRTKELVFDKESQLLRVAISGIHQGYPLFHSGSKDPKRKSAKDAPSSYVVLHPVTERASSFMIRKVRLGPGSPVFFVRAACHDPAALVVGDFVLRLHLFDGELHWLSQHVIGGPDPKTGSPWHEISVDLKEYAGKDVLLIVECAAGGKQRWHCEQASIAEASLR
ncbi:MAG: prenyltransferase/squalene oxidase repeat-containing protein [Planctomycetota bacterium]